MGIVEECIQNEDYSAFCSKVDYQAYPDYLEAIAYPIYLELIEERLNNGFYRRIDVCPCLIQACVYDFNLMKENAMVYNDSKSLLYGYAKKGIGRVCKRVAGLKVETQDSSDGDESFEDDGEFEEVEAVRSKRAAALKKQNGG